MRSNLRRETIIERVLTDWCPDADTASLDRQMECTHFQDGVCKIDSLLGAFARNAKQNHMSVAAAVEMLEQRIAGKLATERLATFQSLQLRVADAILTLKATPRVVMLAHNDWRFYGELPENERPFSELTVVEGPFSIVLSPIELGRYALIQPEE